MSYIVVCLVLGYFVIVFDCVVTYFLLCLWVGWVLFFVLLVASDFVGGWLVVELLLILLVILLLVDGGGVFGDFVAGCCLLYWKLMDLTCITYSNM